MGTAKDETPLRYAGEKGAGEHVAEGLRADLRATLNQKNDLTWNELMSEVYDLRDREHQAASILKRALPVYGEADHWPWQRDARTWLKERGQS